MNQNTYPTMFTNQSAVQGPAYDAYGRPILVTMSNEQRMTHARNIRKQHKKYVQKRLEENYPKIFAIVYSIIMILIGLSSIALQIFSSVSRDELPFECHVILSGYICIFLAVLGLLLIRYPEYSLLVCTIVSHGFGILVLLVLTIVNVVEFPTIPRMILIIKLGLGVLALFACIVFRFKSYNPTNQLM
ncbi:unnamed protein product [Brachionus calyciflorus]|uniref:Uncharacterized protein n=1 Tax=Brachionus calyciflorus TaxID=104777 RepID=A0A813YSF7_9BILA|nr:unnamed protein product [Brachionus calyciflorus]